MKRVVVLLFAAAIMFSCSNPKNKNIDKNFVENPTSLEELFSGFSNEEMTPDVYNLKKDSVVIVATGHLYPLLYHPDVYQSFIKTVKAQHPDYFFALGDIVYNNSEKDWETVLSNFNKIEVPIYYSPGNHDLNYHYERYNGNHDHQVEAEMRYLKKAKCRYKLVKDNLANYVFVNANDSIKRVLAFLNFIRPQLDTTKQLIMMSSPALWFNKQQDPKNPRTWTNRPFRREELLPEISDFDCLIHGDWAGKFFRSRFRKIGGPKGTSFDVMAVGNRKEGDTLYITRITIYKDTIMARPIFVPMPPNSNWYKKKKKIEK